MTVLRERLDEVTPKSHAADLERVREAFRDANTGALRGFGPQREIVETSVPMFVAARVRFPPAEPYLLTGELTCSERRLLSVFKRLGRVAGQSVPASLLWVSWRMFGGEEEIWGTVERLKQRRLVVAGEGRGGLCLTDAGIAILSSL